VIPGDGNCQMHSLSDQLYGNLDHSYEIRFIIVQWLRLYCTKMAKSGFWGDHLTLLAAAEIYKANISIISSVESHNYFVEITPSSVKADKTILLSHHAESHYGSLCMRTK
ncbi:hypothetical protein DICPUDRAFT_11435, partial [Dictyostelium purpureum]